MKQELPQLWQKSVQLSPALKFEDTICVVGDHLGIKTAIDHPHLNRKIAYLGGIEIAPLLKIVNQISSFKDLFDSWNHLVQENKAEQLILWLWSRDILEVA